MPTQQPVLIRLGELEEKGVSRRMLQNLIAAGEYERVAPGAYVRTNAVDDTTASWMAVASRRPDATLCLLSAASTHDLTDEIPEASDIALPRGANRLQVGLAPISWHFFARETFEVGRGLHTLPGGMSIGLYDAERTIVDLFRRRHELGSDLAIGALKTWLARRGSSAGRLLDTARHFPMAYPRIRQVLEVLL